MYMQTNTPSWQGVLLLALGLLEEKEDNSYIMTAAQIIIQNTL